MATTITGQQALFQIAEDVGELHAAFIKTVNSQTSLKCIGIQQFTEQTFSYALARVFGKGIRQITAYSPADETVTLASSFDSNVSAGELIEVVFYDPIRYATAISSINSAIRDSFPYFYREIKTRSALTGTVAIAGSTAVTGTSTRFLDELIVGDYIKVGDESKQVSAITTNTALTVSSAFSATTSGATCYHTSGLTYTTQIHQYALPSSVHELLNIGWALSANDPVSWIPPLSNWRVIGIDGSYLLDLLAGVTWAVDAGSVSIAYANPIVRGGTLADSLNGYTIELHYASREPELTTLSGSTLLPQKYFSIASRTYLERRMAATPVTSDENQRFQACYPYVDSKAREARSWLFTSRPQLASLKGPQVELH